MKEQEQHQIATTFLQKMIQKHHEKLEKQNMQTARFEGLTDQDGDAKDLDESKQSVTEKSMSIVE